VQMQCTITIVNDTQMEGKAFLNHDCHGIRGNHITTPSRHLPCWPMVSHRKRHEKYMWPTNSWIIFVYFLEFWLTSVLYRYLVNSMQNQARSTIWHSAIDRSIAINVLAAPGLRLCQHSQGDQAGSVCKMQLRPSDIVVSSDILRLL